MASRKKTREAEVNVIGVDDEAPRTRTRTRAEARRQEPAEFQVCNVRVGLLPGEMKDIILNGERTVRAAMVGAEINEYEIEGHECRVNGMPAELDQTIKEGDTVIFVRSIEGN